jgi:hypothetical protein
MASGFVLRRRGDGALWNCLEGFGALWRVGQDDPWLRFANLRREDAQARSRAVASFCKLGDRVAGFGGVWQVLAGSGTFGRVRQNDPWLRFAVFARRARRRTAKARVRRREGRET